MLHYTLLVGCLLVASSQYSWDYLEASLVGGREESRKKGLEHPHGFPPVFLLIPLLYSVWKSAGKGTE